MEQKPGRTKRRRRARWGRVAFLAAFLALAAYGWSCWDVYAYSKSSSTKKADAAIVLGAAAWGPKPSPVFAARLDHAAELYKSGQVKKVVVTGGVGRLGGPSEASVGAGYLAKHGVANRDILQEDISRRTYDNLRNAQKLMLCNGLQSALVVSDPLHMRRAIVSCGSLGLPAEPSPTPTSAYKTWDSKLKFLLREGSNMLGVRLGLVQ